MKRLIILFLLFCTLPLFSQESEGFRIEGRLGGTMAGNLMLVASLPQGFVKLGDAVMTNGNFEFSGRVAGLTLAYILTEQQQPIATLMLENRPFTLTTGETGIDIAGGEAQAVWNQFQSITKVISRERYRIEQQVKSAYAAQNQLQLEALQQEYEQLAKQAQAQQDELMKIHKDSPATACFVASAMEQLEYAGLKEMYDMLGEPAKASFFGQVVGQRLSELANLEVGGIAPDFKAPDLNGDTLSLYGIRAKLKLVDFWASWCAPCRAENPNVRKIYMKYHDAGLEIIGVSLDTKKEEWAKALRTDKITWPSVCELSKNSPIAALYAVKGIPCTYLLDADNRIVAKNLRGKDLQKKIEEMLRK